MSARQQFAPEMLERREYIRRWNAASSVVLREYVLRWFPGVWLFLGALIFVQPNGRVAAALWFCWASSLIALLAAVAAFVYCQGKAREATRWPSIWTDFYREPWFMGEDA